MIYGYARVSTDGQSIEAQVRQLRAAGVGKVFREVASGAKTDRARRLLAQLARRRCADGEPARPGWRARPAISSTRSHRSPTRKPVSAHSATHGQTPPRRTGD
jgi:hypothetical protein